MLIKHVKNKTKLGCNSKMFFLKSDQMILNNSIYMHVFTDLLLLKDLQTVHILHRERIVEI